MSTKPATRCWQTKRAIVFADGKARSRKWYCPGVMEPIESIGGRVLALRCRRCGLVAPGPGCLEVRR